MRRTHRLAEDPQRTRERLVTTREEERRHIRRDLHDSLGPALSGQALTLDTARALPASDPGAADGLLRDLKIQSQETLEEVRGIPPDARAGIGTASMRERAEELGGTLHITPGDPAGINIVVVTMFDGSASVLAAVWAGARGYLVNGADRDEILRAVQAAAAGETIFSDTAAQHVADHLTAPGLVAALPRADRPGARADSPTPRSPSGSGSARKRSATTSPPSCPNWTPAPARTPSPGPGRPAWAAAGRLRLVPAVVGRP